MKGIIYKYTNKINGKAYIGQTVDSKNRHLKHLKSSYDKKQKDYGVYFHKAIRKYGIDNFKYEIIVVISSPSKEELRRQLNKAEIFYIDQFDTYKNGYNLTIGGEGSFGCKHSEESVKRGVENRRYFYDTLKGKVFGRPFVKGHIPDNKKAVVQLDKDGKIINRFDSITEAAKAMNRKRETLRDCVLGRQHTCAGYFWKYE